MIKRLLNCSPKEMLALHGADLKDAIRMSEGRTVIAMARARGSNYLQYVTNAEVCAKFGADIVEIDMYDPKNPQFIGLPSKNPEDDEQYRDVQLQVGKGWTLKEVREMVGRPIATIFTPAKPAYGGQSIDTGFADAKGGTVAGSKVGDWDDFELLIEQGFDIIFVPGWCEHKELIAIAKEAVKRANGRVLIGSGVPHGPGLIYAQEEPFNLRELVTPELVEELCKTGIDIIDMPATGSLPAYTKEYVQKLIDIAHSHNVIVNVGIHNSQEGTDTETIRRIAIDNKTAGADMIMLGDAGINENMGLPETIKALCIALKGHRHTYRRMCESVLR